MFRNIHGCSCSRGPDRAKCRLAPRGEGSGVRKADLQKQTHAFLQTADDLALAGRETAGDLGHNPRRLENGRGNEAHPTQARTKWAATKRTLDAEMG
jgi:hypothetical protein